MLDATVAMTDIVANFHSLGVEREWGSGIGIVETFAPFRRALRAAVRTRAPLRPPCAPRLDAPKLADDERFATRAGWQDHLDDVLRPAIESWASDRPLAEVVGILPWRRDGLWSIPDQRPGGGRPAPGRSQHAGRDVSPSDEGNPVLVPGNPVKLSEVPEVPDERVPWLGEHTDRVLADELGLGADKAN
ncbi:MAG: hypothetical protein Ct9H300mP31_19740 [Acidimicrobiaceae bacterium]|nr:MAG: hypothetical protein Ct9H300mP31_19740 [Acidimicrobiaceae bacterium]